jgi:hypothetical protein
MVQGPPQGGITNVGSIGVDEGSDGATFTGSKAMKRIFMSEEEVQAFHDALARLFHILFPWVIPFMNWVETKLERQGEA